MPDLIRYKPRDELSALAGSRETAINRAWVLEKNLINETGTGTRNWSSSELDLIKNTKNGDLLKVMSTKGYAGHHINSVEGNGALGAKWEGDPRNIVFLENHKHPNSTNGKNGQTQKSSAALFFSMEPGFMLHCTVFIPCLCNSSLTLASDTVKRAVRHIPLEVRACFD